MHHTPSHINIRVEKYSFKLKRTKFITNEKTHYTVLHSLHVSGVVLQDHLQ